MVVTLPLNRRGAGEAKMGWPVLYVHGTGNQVREDLLKRHWDAALFDQATDASSCMAYWSSLPYPPPLASSVFDEIDLLPPTSPLEAASPSAAEAPEAVVAEPLETWLRAMVYEGDALADGEDAAPPPTSPLELLSPVKAWQTAFDARDLVVMDHAIRPEYTPMEKVHQPFRRQRQAELPRLRKYLVQPAVQDLNVALFDSTEC
jgi:hypothetical protein